LQPLAVPSVIEESPLLSDQDLMQVQAAAQEMAGPVTVYVSRVGVPDPFEENLVNVCRQISGVSMDRIRIEQGEDPVFPGKPSLTLSGVKGQNIHYMAAPEAREFPPFLEALRWLGGAAEVPDDGVYGPLRGLTTPVQVLVFMAPGCPHCPHVVRSAVSAGASRNAIDVIVVDAMQFPDLAEQFKVKSTPTTIIDGGLTIVGQLSAAQLVDHIVNSTETGSLTAVLDSMIQSGRAEDAASLICRDNRPEAILPLYIAREFSLRMGALVAMEAALDEDPHSLDAIIPDLTNLLTAEEAGLRGDTAALLGKIGNPAAIPALRKALDDPDPDVREAAEEALQEIEETSAETRPC
jgi:hypothetical protein